ncbi:MAG: spore coat protein GerQ [Bacilli bacterium]
MNNGYYRQNSYETGYMPVQNNIPNMQIEPNNNESKYQYAETVLNSSIGRKASIHMSFPDSIEWRDKIFTGTIEASGKDYLLIKDEQNRQFLLWNIYINFIEFND